MSKKNRAKSIKRGQIYLCITGPLCREPIVTHGPHIGPELGKTFPSNDVILCTAFDPLSVQDDKITQYISAWKFRNALKSNLKKINDTGKLIGIYIDIDIYHLEGGTILSRPQSIAVET